MRFRNKLVLLAVLAIAAVAASTAQAGYFFTPATGDMWLGKPNWTYAPDGGDVLNQYIVGGAGTGSWSGNTYDNVVATLTGKTFNAGTLTIGNDKRGQVVVNSGANLQSNKSDMYVGYNSAGTLAINGGTVTVSNGTNTYSIYNLQIGFNAGSSGTVSQSGGLVYTTAGTNSGNINVGNSGVGGYYISGGTLSTKGYGGAISIGNNTGSTGSFTQTGGSVSPNLFVYVGKSGVGSYYINNGSLETFEGYVGYSGGNGTFTQDGGAVTFGADLFVGGDYAHVATGSYTINASTLNVKADVFIGEGGNGTFTQTGGLVALTSNDANPDPSILVLGMFNGAGVYNMSGGTLSIALPPPFVSTDYQGSIVLGYITNNGNLANGTMKVSGSSVVNVNGLIVGEGNSLIGSVFQQDGGTVTVGSTDPRSVDLRVAYHGGSQGQYLMNGGVLNIDGAGSIATSYDTGAEFSIIGGAGFGTFTQTGGTVNIAANLSIGQISGGNGTYTISGDASVLNLYGGTNPSGFWQGNLVVGDSGYGTFTQNAGVVTVSGSLYVGYNNSAYGSYNLNGGALNLTGTSPFGSNYSTAAFSVIGNNTSGSFAQTGGTVNVASNLSVGRNQFGTYTMSGAGSVLNLYGGSDSSRWQGNLIVGENSLGFFTQNAGAVTVSGALYLGYSGLGNSGSYYLNNGTLHAGAMNVGVTPDTSSSGFFQYGGSAGLAGDVSGYGTYGLYAGSLSMNAHNISVATFNFSGGTLTNAGTVSTAIHLTGSGHDATFNLVGTGSVTTVTGATNGPGGLTKAGSGALKLVGGSAWNSVLNAGGANLNAGKIVFDYTSDSDPAATIASDLKTSYNSASSSHFGSGQIYSSTATSQFGLGWKDDTVKKQVTVMYTYYGDTNLDGSVNLTDLGVLLDHYGASGDVWSQGDFNYDGSVNLTDLGILLDHYNSTLAGATVGATLDSAAIRLLAAHGISVVPEPGTLALLAAGLIGLVAYAWRKRK